MFYPQKDVQFCKKELKYCFIPRALELSLTAMSVIVAFGFFHSEIAFPEQKTTMYTFLENAVHSVPFLFTKTIKQENFLLFS